MRGITLFEVLVYTGLFSLLVTGVFISFVHIQEGMERVEAGSRLTDEGLFILNTLQYEVERAQEVEVIDGSQILLTNETGTSSIYLTNGTLMHDVEGKATPLSESTSNLSSLYIVKRDNGSIFVSFSLDVRARSGYAVSDSFAGTAFPFYLR